MDRAALDDLLRCPATGQRLRLDAAELAGDEVLYGTLTAEGSSYPVLAGVPVLLPGREESVALLRQGRHAEAAAAALWHELSPTRLGRLARALEVARPGSAPGRAVAQADRRRLQVRLAPLLDPAAADPAALIRLGFGWGPGNPEAVAYFTHRFGTPRHLVSLAASEAVEVDPGALVLDLGCGGGHLSWNLQQRFGAEGTVGLDLSLFELWAARQLTGSTAFVCGDATALPFRGRAFGLVVASDVLSFVRAKWSAFREAQRVATDPGVVVVSAVKSSLHPHVYAGMPLSPSGWRGLAGDGPHQLLADDHIVDRYLRGLPLDLDDPGDVDAAPTVTLMAGPPERQRRGRGEDDWPHARGPLGVNPLLRPAGRAAGGVRYRRQLPTEGFGADNPALAGYLPEEITVPDDAVLGDRLDPERVRHLVPSTAVLGLPPPSRARPAIGGGLPT